MSEFNTGMPPWSEADCRWLVVMLGRLPFVRFSCLTFFIHLSSSCRLLFLFSFFTLCLHFFIPLISIQSVSSHSHVHHSLCTALRGSFSFQSLSVFLTSFLLVIPLSRRSRLVQCEQGLSMKIFNYTPRLLDTPHFLLNSPPPLQPFPLRFSHSHSHLPHPHPSTLTFLNSFCKYMFTQCKWMVSTAVNIEQTVHFTMCDY